MSLITTSDALTLTEHGIRIHRPLTWEEWREVMSSLRTVKKTYISALADLTRHGREQFGDDQVAKALEQMEFEWSDASKAGTVSNLPLDLRSEFRLSSEHAYVLASRYPDDHEQQRHWAALTAKHDLTALELKTSIAEGRIVRQSDIEARAGHAPGIPTVQGVRFQFDKWSRSLGDLDTLTRKPTEEKKRILETLKPIVEFARQLENSLT